MPADAAIKADLYAWHEEREPMRNIINIATLILAPAQIDYIQIPRFTFYINAFRRGLGPPALVFYYNKNRYTLLERIDNALSKRGKSKKRVHSLTLINAHSQAISNIASCHAPLPDNQLL